MEECVFENNYTHAIDQKNRLFIPAEYRAKLGEEFVICTPPGADECIIVYTLEEWDRYFKGLREVCSGRDLAYAERMAISSKKRVTADKQGRITLTQEFCKYAGLEKEALIMGVGNRVEIWSPDKWNAFVTDFRNAPPAWISNITL